MIFITAVFVESAKEVAVTTAVPADPDAGAVYVAKEVVVAERVPDPLMLQLTPLFKLSFDTVALKFTL